MSLLEEARARKPRPTGPACKVRRAIVAHPDLADDIIAVIRDRAIIHKAAAETFREHSIAIGVQVVEGHRANGCAHCEYHGHDLSPLVDA